MYIIVNVKKFVTKREILPGIAVIGIRKFSDETLTIAMQGR